MEQNLLPVGTFVEHATYGTGEIVGYGENHGMMEIERGLKYGYYQVKFEGQKEIKTFQLSSIGTYLNVIA